MCVGVEREREKEREIRWNIPYTTVRVGYMQAVVSESLGNEIKWEWFKSIQSLSLVVLLYCVVCFGGLPPGPKKILNVYFWVAVKGVLDEADHCNGPMSTKHVVSVWKILFVIKSLSQYWWLSSHLWVLLNWAVFIRLQCLWRTRYTIDSLASTWLIVEEYKVWMFILHCHVSWTKREELLYQKTCL